MMKMIKHFLKKIVLKLLKEEIEDIDDRLIYLESRMQKLEQKKNEITQFWTKFRN